MSRAYTSASYSSQLLPRCCQVWAPYFPLLVLPHSAMWGVLFLFPEEETDPMKDIEITELGKRGIRILTKKGPYPPELMDLPHDSTTFSRGRSQVGAGFCCPRLPTSHLHRVFCPLCTGTHSMDGVSFSSLASQAPGLLYTAPFWDLLFV